MLVNRITANRIDIKAPAKINLFLEVLNRREDGYHNINSLFQAVSLFDVLEFTATGKSRRSSSWAELSKVSVARLAQSGFHQACA